MNQRKMKCPQMYQMPKSGKDRREEENISFSIAYLTKNKNYNFEHFGSSRLRDELEARKALDELLQVLSCSSWMSILQRRKRDFGGVETLSARAIHFTPSDGTVSEDEKYLSFRFFSQKYRLLGRKIGSVLYIVGFDFDYSAYNHGS